MFELKTPPGAIVVAEESVGVFLVGELQVNWVPEQLAERQGVPELNTQGHVAQQDGLGQRSSPVKIGTRHFAAFAGRDPLLVVVGATGNGRSEEHTSELQLLRHLVC